MLLPPRLKWEAPRQRHEQYLGLGDVDTLTVQEYQSLSFWGRLRYRTYRHPLVMFGVGPAYLFLLQHRLPVGLFRGGWWPWLSVMATNVAIAAIAAGLIWFVDRRRDCRRAEQRWRDEVRRKVPGFATAALPASLALMSQPAMNKLVQVQRCF